MPKIVLFKELGRYCITSEENYNAYARNASAISKFPVNCPKEDALNSLINWGVANAEDIIDKTGE